MAAVNAAYRLVRDAPLRYHRVSTGARPDDPWTDDELQSAIRRTRIDHAVSRRIGVALGGFALAIFFILRPMIAAAHPTAAPLLGVALCWAAFFFIVQTPTGLFIWRTLYLIKTAGYVFRDLSRLVR
jgi:hypothetical protein